MLLSREPLEPAERRDWIKEDRLDPANALRRSKLIDRGELEVGEKTRITTVVDQGRQRRLVEESSPLVASNSPGIISAFATVLEAIA